MTTEAANSSELVSCQSLTTEERQQFERCERVIEKNMLNVVEFGQALATIRDLKLYREQFTTWEEYVFRRWEIKARTSYQYITAFEVYENVRNCAQTELLPSNEYQLRQLARLDDFHRAEAWLKAVETSPDGKVTGRHVASVVASMLGEQVRKKATAQQQRVKSSDLPESLKEIVWKLIEEVREARLNNLQKNVRESLRKRITGILELLED